MWHGVTADVLKPYENDLSLVVHHFHLGSAHKHKETEKGCLWKG